MKYIKIGTAAPYAGTERVEAYKVEDTFSSEDMEEAFQEAVENCIETWEYLVTGWDGDLLDLSKEEDQQEYEFYREGCYENSYATFITREEYLELLDGDEEEEVDD